jgi:putative salt-induced outer membrane protein YdiY
MDELQPALPPLQCALFSRGTGVAKRIRTSIAMIIMTAAASGLQADVLDLDDGTRLVGTIEQITGTEALLSDTFAGNLSVPRVKIVGIATDAPVTVQFNDDGYATGRLARSELNGTLTLEVDGLGVRQLPISEIKGVYREDPQLIQSRLLAVRLAAEANVGIILSRGNSESENLNLDGRLVTRTPRNRYTLTGQFNREESEGILVKENWRSLVKYDHFVSEKWFWFNSVNFESDQFADLDLRTALAAGMGYQFFDSPTRTLSVEFGPSYIEENFDVAEDDSFLGTRWALNFEQRVREGLTFFHFNDGLLGLEASDQLTIRSRTGLRLNLTQRIIARIQTSINWDQSPPAGTDSTDVQHALTVGFRL